MKDLQTHDDPGILGGLALGDIVVCGDSDDSMHDFVSKGHHMVRG